MKRWNGWGNIETEYFVPPNAVDYLHRMVGDGARTPDASLEEVICKVPISKIPQHPLISVDAEERLRHARGQSLPDWVAMRSGEFEVFPDGVAHPSNREEVADLLKYAEANSIKVIPYGGGSSVLGHINPQKQNGCTLTIDMSRMNEFIDFDKESHLATFGAGIAGPELENLLHKRGFTLGHFPQSFEYSTLGGWIATRSCGQQCYYFGRIEEDFAGGHLETLRGAMDLPPLPASAAGPDLKHLVLGSEGRLGIITDAIVRVKTIPEYEKFSAVFFSNWDDGTRAVREIINEGIGVSMCRLSDAQETITTLELSGKVKLINLANRGLSLIGKGPDRCLLIYGITGDKRSAHSSKRRVMEVISTYHGFPVDFVIGDMWKKTRFTTPYLRNSLWDLGYAMDTLETALPWSKVVNTIAEVKKMISDAGQAEGIKPLVFSHLSHHYQDGSGIYVMYLWPRSIEPQQTLSHWIKMKTAASQTIIAHGGTISHQHGVGVDHAPYLVNEKSHIGMQYLNAVLEFADPHGILNPGKLIADQEE
jgi:alkyldihydroxyacetonephosphate synthase